jgi:hypothetical protein
LLEETRQPAAALLPIQSTRPPAPATESDGIRKLVLHKPAPLLPIEEEPWEDAKVVCMTPSASRESLLRIEPAPPTLPPTRKCPPVPVSDASSSSSGASSSGCQPQVPEEWRQPAAPLVPIQSTLAPVTASAAISYYGVVPSVTEALENYFLGPGGDRHAAVGVEIQLALDDFNSVDDIHVGTDIGADDDVNRDKTVDDFETAEEKEEFHEYTRLRTRQPDVKFTVVDQRTRQTPHTGPNLPPMLRLALFVVELGKFATLTGQKNEFPAELGNQDPEGRF